MKFRSNGNNELTPLTMLFEVEESSSKYIFTDYDVLVSDQPIVQKRNKIHLLIYREKRNNVRFHCL